MMHDDKLAERIEVILKGMDLPNFERKEMFGSIGFAINGNTAVGIYKKQLLVRIEPDIFDAVLQNPNTTEFDVTRSYMKDWILVDEKALEKEEDLSKWIKKGIDSVILLPSK